MAYPGCNNAAQGGCLGTVRDIVANTIQAEKAAGQSVNMAQTVLAAGNDAFAAGQYRQAFEQYTHAYHDAVCGTSTAECAR